MKPIVFAIAAGLALAASAVLAEDAGDAVNGRKHFFSDGCWQCHGDSANGAALTGPKLARTALPFEAFVMQLRHPSNEMPPYEAAIVPDKTAADIYAWLKSLPPSPDAKSLSLLTGMGVK
jgi:mono/diheme cytochrome c family protein